MRAREIREVAPEIEARKRPMKFRQARDRFERAYVDYIMRHCDGNREWAAQVLGISMSSLKEKLRKGFGGRR